MTLYDTPVIVTEEIDRITIDVGYGLYKRLLANHPVEVASRYTAEFIAEMVAQYPPQGRCSECGELWAFDEHGPCTREGDAPAEQWQVTTPPEVYA